MDELNFAKADLISQTLTDEAGSTCIHRKKNAESIGSDCQLESTTAKLLSSLEATAQNFAEKRRKTKDHDDTFSEKYRQLLVYEDAPIYLQFNPFIRSGYRAALSSKMCLESMFWWTNETINIWSHVFGSGLFFFLAIYDNYILGVHAGLTDKIIVGMLLLSFQICMMFSSIYHIFSCRSQKHFNCFLSVDLLGIALSLLAIYISGIYYAFWCHETIRQVYIVAVAVIFITAIISQIPKYNVNNNIQIIVFVAWAAFGILPAMHWTIEMGGFKSPLVQLLVPRVIGMYIISGIAFLIYILKIPERWFVGKVDFCGHSHNWWHIFVLIALYYWHNTGMKFALYMIENNCIDDRTKCYV